MQSCGPPEPAGYTGTSRRGVASTTFCVREPAPPGCVRRGGSKRTWHVVRLDEPRPPTDLRRTAADAMAADPSGEATVGGADRPFPPSWVGEDTG